MGLLARSKESKKSSVFLRPFSQWTIGVAHEHGGLQVISPQVIEQRKRSIQKRLDRSQFIDGYEQPVISASNIEYEIAERTRAISYGGIGMIHMLARQSELIDAINRHLHLFKLYLPPVEALRSQVLSAASDLSFLAFRSRRRGGTEASRLRLRRSRRQQSKAVVKRRNTPSQGFQFSNRYTILRLVRTI